MQLDRQESITSKTESDLRESNAQLRAESAAHGKTSTALQETTEKLKTLEQENSSLKVKLQAKQERESRRPPNLYAYGNCTWYVKEKVPYIGGTWGNASSWLASAKSDGFEVGEDPRQGAIGVAFEGYYGHVVLVESVNKDGSVTISEMNNSALGGFNIVSTRIASSQSFKYIYT